MIRLRTFSHVQVDADWSTQVKESWRELEQLTRTVDAGFSFDGSP